jgi:DNA polymerase III delta prime subunit
MKNKKLTTFILIAGILTNSPAYAGEAISMWRYLGKFWSRNTNSQKARENEIDRAIITEDKKLKKKAISANGERKDYNLENIADECNLQIYDDAFLATKRRYIGNDDKINQTAAKMEELDKPNLCVTGEPGVGKTSFIRGFANWLFTNWRAIKGMDKPPMIVQTSVADIMAGTTYQGDIQEKWKWFVRWLEEQAKTRTVYVYIDELHQIMDAGASNDGSSGLAQMAKPLLTETRADGLRIRFLGSTTTEESAVFRRDKAWQRRWFFLGLEAPTDDAAIGMIKGNLEPYEERFGVKYPDHIIELFVRLGRKYFPNRAMPDPAFDFVNAAGSAALIDQVESREVVKFRSQLSELQHRIDRLGLKDTPAQKLELESALAEKGRLQGLMATADTKWRQGRETLLGANEAMTKAEGELRRLQAEHMKSVQKTTKADDLAGIQHNHDLNEAIEAQKKVLDRKIEEQKKVVDAWNTEGNIIEISDEQAFAAIASQTGYRVEDIARNMDQTLDALHNDLPRSVPGQAAALKYAAKVIEPGIMGMKVGDRPSGVLVLIDSAGQKEDFVRAIDTKVFGARNEDEVLQAHLKTWIIDFSDPMYQRLTPEQMRDELVKRPFRAIGVFNAQLIPPHLQTIFAKLAENGRADVSYLGEGRPLIASDAVFVFHFGDFQMGTIKPGDLDRQRETYVRMYAQTQEDPRLVYFVRQIANQADAFIHLKIPAAVEYIAVMQQKLAALSRQIKNGKWEKILKSPIELRPIDDRTVLEMMKNAPGLAAIDKAIEDVLNKRLYALIKAKKIKGGDIIDFVWDAQKNDYVVYANGQAIL